MRRSELPRRLMLAALATATLLTFSCATAPPPKKDTSLTDLVQSGNIAAISDFFKNQKQLNQPDGQGLYPLHHAVVKGDIQIVKVLLALGAEPDVRDPAGKTPLRYAIDRRQPAVAKTLVENSGAPADPFVADVSGTTPAEICLAAGNDMIGAIFNARNINRTGQDGRTILHMAADNLQVNEVGLLIDMGASVQTKDKADRTALDLALLRPQYKSAALIAERIILKGAVSSFHEFDWFATTVRSADYNTVRFSNGNTPLHEAISRLQLGFADYLLSKGLTPNIKNLGGDAPLHLTVKMGWIDGAELLLKNGADPDIRDGKANTPLLLPSPASLRLDMTRLLLRYRADSSLKDQEGNTALHKAVKLSYEPLVVEELLKAGTPVNSANLEGDTPLMICAKAGNYQYANALIAAGADVFLKNIAGESPLSIAVGRGVDAVDKIVLTGNVLQHDNKGNSVIATAVALKGSPEVVSLILAKGADPNVRNNSLDNTLHIAVRLNLQKQGLLLIAAKTDIFAVNSANETPVFLALAAADGPYDWFFIPSVITARNANGDTVGHLAARRNLADGLEYLRTKGLDLLAVNSAREGLLHAAVKMDAAEAARYLIANGASPAARDVNGDASLNTAVLAGAKTCLQVLVLSGVDLDARNFTGEAALHQAIRKQNRDFVTFLVERGASLAARDNRGLTPLAVAAKESQTGIAQYLIKSGSILDARDYSGSTPLYHAVDAGQLDLIRTMVQSGANILARNAAGDSPLLASLKKGSAVVREILGGPSVDRADADGKTPLRILVETRATAELLSLAIAAGAECSSRDRLADTPLHAALIQKDYVTAGILLAAKADPFAPNYQGLTPIAIVLQDTTAIKDFTLAAGLSCADSLGETFLHYAVRAGNADAVKLLLDMGLARDARNVSGESARDVAMARASQAIQALFN